MEKYTDLITHSTPLPLDKLPDREKSDITPINIVRDEKGQFLPGSVASPGRPRRSKSISDQLQHIINMSQEELKAFTPNTGAQMIALDMFKNSKDPQILKELLNRVEGKVVEQIEVEQRSVNIVYELERGKDG